MCLFGGILFLSISHFFRVDYLDILFTDWEDADLLVTGSGFRFDSQLHQPTQLLRYSVVSLSG